jgi:hypothetical protein
LIDMYKRFGLLVAGQWRGGVEGIRLSRRETRTGGVLT